uniref:Uncharacterized protein n=1 Tax=Oryza sativa subsp. japonica TaxID=39947 RepID=Q84YY1_ORYSJ|nr:hypothetical protein [Oryza sativa Japonica Group]BAD01202.1 hypothetical protein [Oryza sativa Japonica Group]
MWRYRRICQMVDDNHVENEMGGELDDRQMASNSNGDRPVGKLLEEERKVFEEIVGCNSEISQFEDLGNAGWVVTDKDLEY